MKLKMIRQSNFSSRRKSYIVYVLGLRTSEFRVSYCGGSLLYISSQDQHSLETSIKKHSTKQEPDHIFSTID